MAYAFTADVKDNVGHGTSQLHTSVLSLYFVHHLAPTIHHLAGKLLYYTQSHACQGKLGIQDKAIRTLECVHACINMKSRVD